MTTYELAIARNEMVRVFRLLLAAIAAGNHAHADVFRAKLAKEVKGWFEA